MNAADVSSEVESVAVEKIHGSFRATVGAAQSWGSSATCAARAAAAQHFGCHPTAVVIDISPAGVCQVSVRKGMS